MPAVLVVDGERAQFDELEGVLGGAGYHTAWSASAAEALRLAHRQPTALIVIDNATPCVDADEVILVLRQDPDTAHIPLLLLCDRTNSSLADGLGTDADMVLEKPVDPDELVAVVRRLLAIPRRRERPWPD